MVLDINCDKTFEVFFKIAGVWRIYFKVLMEIISKTIIQLFQNVL